MTDRRRTRNLSAEDHARLRSVLDRFREEFAVWAQKFRNDWELLAFVHYEGINVPIVHEAGPLILGEKCVQLYGARWCMLEAGDAWHFGIDHDDFDEPVNLSVFNRKRVRRSLSRRWQQRLLSPAEQV